MMRRIVLLMVAVLMTVVTALSASPAFAQGGADDQVSGSETLCRIADVPVVGGPLAGMFGCGTDTEEPSEEEPGE